MDGNRVLKAGQGVESWPRRRISAAEWMGAEAALSLIASAEVEAEQVRRSAVEVRAAAREEGRAEGRLEAAAELTARLAALAEAQARWRARSEVEALDLAVEMARRIIGRELQSDAAAVRDGAVAALRAAGRRRALRLRLHPDGVASLREQAASLAEATAGAALELVADPALAPGDVVVETEAGLVDGRIDSRLEGFRVAIEREAA